MLLARRMGFSPYSHCEQAQARRGNLLCHSCAGRNPSFEYLIFDLYFCFFRFDFYFSVQIFLPLLSCHFNDPRLPRVDPAKPGLPTIILIAAGRLNLLVVFVQVWRVNVLVKPANS